MTKEVIYESRRRTTKENKQWVPEQLLLVGRRRGIVCCSRKVDRLSSHVLWRSAAAE
jgi:hypothetical protein